jgi:alanyl-tRNA synthetase
MVVVIGDGVLPSNTGRGYVLRRLLRRVLTTLWRVDPTYTLDDLSSEPITNTIGHFGLGCDDVEVRRLLLDEERRFGDLVTRGRRVVVKELMRGPLDESRLRDLHETHGLPRELVQSLVADLEPGPGIDGRVLTTNR